MSQKLIVVILGFLILLFPKSVFSSILINEFQIEPTNLQWVELFNNSTESADISGWIIDDSGGTEKYIIENNTIIASSSFKIVSSGKFNFNKSSPDSVQIIDRNNLLIDRYDYFSSPGENITYGRLPDVFLTWGICTPTPEAKNDCHPLSSPTPTPTISPTNTPTSSPTAKPTVTSTPTTTSKPTSIITIQKPLSATATLTQTLSSFTNTASDSPVVYTTTDVHDIENMPNDATLSSALFENVNTNYPKENEIKQLNNSKKKFTNRKIIILSVVFFLAGCIALIYTLQRERRNCNQ